MIVGIGTDIVEIARVEKAIRNERFLRKCFTPLEIDFCTCANGQRFAGNFAAKEAVSKALGTGFRGVDLKDIEVLRIGTGAPYVVLHGSVKVLAEELQAARIMISISHCKDYAIAYCVAEGGL